MHIVSSYYFKNLSPQQLENLKFELCNYASQQKMRGLCLIGPEGFNGTLSMPEDKLSACQQKLKQLLQAPDLSFKVSTHSKHPFDSFKVKIKPEIITYKNTKQSAACGTSAKTSAAPISNSRQKGAQPPLVNFYKHLEPNKWHQQMQNSEAVVLDVRNSYEYRLGHFKNSIHFNLSEFSQITKHLPQKSAQKSEAVSKDGSLKKLSTKGSRGAKVFDVCQADTPILLYCTGGIRCEKVLVDLEDRGFTNVHQLSGGVLNYLKYAKAQNISSQWQGECFVFDYRVAVDANLQASQQYRICPHCGDPGNKAIECLRCHTQCTVCCVCFEASRHRHTCSKNCAYIWSRTCS